MRARLHRWNLPGLPLRTSRRALRRLAALRARCPPRVAAAALSTLWNRWCTARRFQRVGNCVLGCGGREDSIEHYARCSRTRAFAASFLRPGFAAGEGPEMLMLTHGRLEDPDALVRAGVLVYAVYRTTERLRRAGGDGEQAVRQALQQAAREAVRGHPSATRLLDGAWTQAAQ